MGLKNIPYWLKGMLIGLIVRMTILYPMMIVIAILLMLISPEILSYILDYTVKLVPCQTKVTVELL